MLCLSLLNIEFEEQTFKTFMIGYFKGGGEYMGFSDPHVLGEETGTCLCQKNTGVNVCPLSIQFRALLLTSPLTQCKLLKPSEAQFSSL